MALSAPPFAEQNASHSAALFRQAAGSGFWPAHGALGFNDLQVNAQSTPNMTVQVTAGQGWVQGTSTGTISGIGVGQQGSYYVLSDTAATLTIAAANATNPRIDVCYLRILDTAFGDASNTAILGVVTGTPAVSPAVPALPANSLDLGHVRVNAAVTSITTSALSYTSRYSGTLNLPQYASAAGVFQLGTEATLPGQAASNPPVGALFLCGDTYNLYANVGGGSWVWLANATGNGQCTVYQTVAQTGIASNAFVNIGCSTASAGAMQDGIGITIPAGMSGYYLVDGLVSGTNFASNPIELSTWITVNGSFPAASNGGRVLGTGTTTAFQTAAPLGARVMFLNAGDLIRLVASSNVGWDTNASASNTASWLSVSQIRGNGRFLP